MRLPAMIDLINGFLLLVAAINILLGVLIYANNRRANANRIYVLNILTIVGWIVGMFFYRSADVSLVAWTRLLYIPPIFIAATFLYFTYFFPSADARLSLRRAVVIFLPAVILALLVAIPSVIIRSVAAPPDAEKAITFGTGYIIYAAYIIFYFSFGLFRLLKKWLASSDAQERRHIGYLLIGYLIAANLAMATNLILPWIGYFNLNWLGQLFTIFMVVPVTYAIVRHGLFNIKLIATEFLVFVIWVATFANVLLARTPTERLLQIGILAFVIAFGILIVKSVLDEVRRKEELERLSRELQTANAELKRLDQLKSDFLSFASHQLRGPLTAIKGYISMIAEGSYGAITADTKEPLDRVYKSNEQLIRLVDDFLNLARIEEGRIQYTFASGSVEDLLDDVTESLTDAAFKKGLELRWARPSPPLPGIVMDASKIREVLYNLVDNAIKYTGHGWVGVEAARTRSGVRVTVRDTGVGLDAAEIGQLFRRFGRAGGSRNSNTSGVGIGLYIARYVVEAHGGRIWAESPGKYKGSMFSVELPPRPPVQAAPTIIKE